MSSLQHPARSSSHWKFASPAFLKELKELRVWCQIHSEKCWCSLILHAVGIKLGLACVCTSKLCNQNQFCSALFWYTLNKQSHRKENSECFCQNGVEFIYSVSSWSVIKNIYLFPASCTSAHSYMMWMCQHKSDSGGHSVHRQRWYMKMSVKGPQLPPVKWKKLSCQKAALQGCVDLLCAASWNNSEAVTL